MYKTDIHVHTAESSKCAKVKVNKLLKLYSKKEYTTLVITDHLSEYNLHKYSKKKWAKQIDYICRGFEFASTLSKEYEINILFSVEITLTETKSDYLIYGITKDFLYEHEKIYNFSLKELHKLCIDNGFLLIQAHPFRDNTIRAAFEDVDGYEGFNGRYNIDSKNEKAMHYGMNSGKHILSGSDVHEKKDIAQGGILTEQPVISIEELLDNLKYKNIKLIKNS